eukprot:1402340-Pyramimonas_sp.AAC.1
MARGVGQWATESAMARAIEPCEFTRGYNPCSGATVNVRFWYTSPSRVHCGWAVEPLKMAFSTAPPGPNREFPA